MQYWYGYGVFPGKFVTTSGKRTSHQLMSLVAAYSWVYKRKTFSLSELKLHTHCHNFLVSGISFFVRCFPTAVLMVIRENFVTSLDTYISRKLWVWYYGRYYGHDISQHLLLYALVDNNTNPGALLWITYLHVARNRSGNSTLMSKVWPVLETRRARRGADAQPSRMTYL